MNSAVIAACMKVPGGAGASCGTTRRIKLRPKATLIPQPTTPPISAAVTRSTLRGACRRRPSSSMNAVPTSGIAISAATPAAPPARAAGRSSRRHQRPRSPEPRAGRHAQIRRGRLGPHRPARGDRREDGERANRRQAPGESFLFARAVDDVAADVRPDRARRKRPPRRRPRGVGARRRRLAEPLQHQHGDRQPEQRHQDHVPEGLAGGEVHPRLQHQGHAHDQEATANPPSTAPRPAVPTLDQLSREGQRIGTTQLLAAAQGDEGVTGGDGRVVCRVEGQAPIRGA